MIRDVRVMFWFANGSPISRPSDVCAKHHGKQGVNATGVYSTKTKGHRREHHAERASICICIVR
jgi:hypothetical protein